MSVKVKIENVEIRNSQEPDPWASIVVNGEEFWPLSGKKPYFHTILSKSNVSDPNQLWMPPKMHSSLPRARVPVVLTYMGKSWEMNYLGSRPSARRFDINWRHFVIDNNLKAGDALVFELLDCDRKKIKFRVQILRRGSPAALPFKGEEGYSASNPIIIKNDD